MRFSSVDDAMDGLRAPFGVARTDTFRLRFAFTFRLRNVTSHDRINSEQNASPMFKSRVGAAFRHRGGDNHDGVSMATSADLPRPAAAGISCHPANLPAV